MIGDVWSYSEQKFFGEQTARRACLRGHALIFLGDRACK